MASITPKTELAAVNLILRNMGETPVNSLSGTLPIEASQAQDTLIEVSEDVQSAGWFFNREYFRLSPDNYGYINLPANTLSVRSDRESRNIPVEARGTRLYNMTPYGSTFKFTGPMQLQLVLGLAFDELPSNARRYIALRAARIYQARELGDQLLLQEDNEEERRAYAELKAEQLRREPLSLLSASGVYNIARSGG